jgi:hypothetical protein
MKAYSESFGFALIDVSPAGNDARSRTRLEADLGEIYMEIMAKSHPVPAAKVVGASKSGCAVTVRGAGALKGRLTIERGIDLTKPIASQVLKGSRRRDDGSSTKR